MMVDPEERRRIGSALLGVLGFLCLMAVFAFLVVPGLRYRPQAYAVDPVPAGLGDTGWLDPTDTPAAPRKVLPPMDPEAVMQPTPALLARGRALYARLCVACHVPEGKADGPAARGLQPPPRDFTRPEGWTYGPGRADIYKTLEEGVQGTGMASYATLGRKDRMALVHEVRSLAAFKPDPEDPASLAALAKLFSATGETIPARIPVGDAIGRMVREYAPPAPLETWDGNPWTREGIQDPTRAAQTLAGLPWKAHETAFVKGVAASLPGNGFAPAVLTFTPGQWQALYSALGGAPCSSP